MRLPAVFLVFLLALTACVVPGGGTPASPPAAPSPASTSTKPTAAATESRAPVLNATLETSLLVTEWKGQSEGTVLFPLDPASGEALPSYTPISLGQSYSYAFSPDRRMLAVVSFPNGYLVNGNLSLIDLTTWKAQKFEVKLNGGVMVFSPDGQRLAIASGDYTSKLSIFDLKQAAIVTQGQTDLLVSRLKFTSGGDALMLYGQVIKNRFTENEMSGGPPQALLLDAANLSPRWSAELEGIRDGIYPKDEKTTLDLSQPGTGMYLYPALAFAPDRNALYIVHADSEKLTTIDFDTQKVETVEIHPRLSWLERLLSLTAGVAYAKVADGTSKYAAVSPDGQFLYVVGVDNASSQDQQGNWQISQTPLGLEIIQTSDGNRVERFETGAADLSLSPDSRFLYLHNWADSVPWTQIFDTSSSQIVTRKAGLYLTPALRLNGELLLVSTYPLTNTSYRMSVLQPDDLSVLAEWTGSDYIAWLTPQ